LLTLIEPGDHGTRRQRAVLGRGYHRDGQAPIDDLLDAVRAAGDRIEDDRAFGEALVLHDLDPGAVAHRVGAVLEALDAPDVEPHRGLELQRPPTGGLFRPSEHHAYLVARLIQEIGLGSIAV